MRVPYNVEIFGIDWVKIRLAGDALVVERHIQVLSLNVFQLCRPNMIREIAQCQILPINVGNWSSVVCRQASLSTPSCT